jgi:hypothetical protein
MLVYQQHRFLRGYKVIFSRSIIMYDYHSHGYKIKDSSIL